MMLPSAGRILIVEDDPLVAEDIERTVKNLGYEVVGSTPSGEKAISIAAAKQPDLALMDINLEGKMDGITAGGILRSTHGTALVYLTAFSDQKTFDRAKITEPYGYVVKPFRETDLRIAIGLALYKKSAEQSPEHEERPQDATVPEIVGGTTAIGNIANFLSGLELFASLSDAARRSFAAQCAFENFKQGDLIICEGDEKSPVFVLESGRVAMTKTSESGKELVVELLFPGDLLSVVAAFEDGSSSLTAKVQANARVLRIPKQTLFQLLSKHPEFYQYFVKESARRLRAAHNMMRAIAHNTVEARIASALAELAKRPGCCSDVESGVSITRQEIADLTGTTVETAIRVTRALEDKGILELSKRGTIKILLPAELKQLAAV